MSAGASNLPQRPQEQQQGEQGAEKEGGIEGIVCHGVFHGEAPFLGMRKHLGAWPK